MSSPTTPLFAGGGGGGTHPAQAQRGAADAGGGGGGSYTPVLVVLGVIAALLVVSCLVGRVCTRRHLRPRPRRDRVAYYDDDMEGGFGHGHGPPHGGHGGIAKMEAPVAPAASVEMRPAGDGAVAVAAVHETAA
ncbi:hypothetical protein ACP70R_039367 [Stipagrostis hirtigluma subsp. patula]